MSPSYPVYVYECEICHGEIRLDRRENLPRCLRCGKRICAKCSFMELCKADFDSLPQRDKDALNLIETKYNPLIRKAGNICAAWAFIFIAVIVLFAISVPFRFLDLIWLPLGVGGVGIIAFLKWYFHDKTLTQARLAARKEVLRDFLETSKNLPLDQPNAAAHLMAGEEPARNARPRICATCGRELRPDAGFCDNCGQKVPKLG